MIPLALFAAALLVRFVAGGLFPGPAYPDSYYYVNVAQQLAAGNGFGVDYIWSFVEVGGRLPDNPALPIPSNAHWMPLASLVQVPFIWLLGATPLAYGLPFWIIGALAAPLTWAIGRDAGLSRMTSAAAGAMVAVPGTLLPFVTQPDNFGLFMVLGPLALWLCARGLRGDRRAFVAGGLVVALATLARNDGLLLGVPFAVVALRDTFRQPDARTVGLAAAAGCAALFALVMAPWVIRQVDVFGTISPSGASGRILWILDYAQLHSVAEPLPAPASLLEHGIGTLLISRLSGLAWAVGLFVLMPLVVALAPLFLVGTWVKRREPAFGPFVLYAGVLFAASALLFAVHVPYGTFIHSAVALLPHTYLLAVVGIAGVVGWVAQRRRTWDARRAAVFFTVGAVLLVSLGGVLQAIRTTDQWAAVQSVQRQLVDGVPSAGQAERVMSADPGAYRYLGGNSGVVTVNDPLPLIEQVARAYQVRWLALESSAIVPALAPVLRGTERLGWLSAPVLTIPDSDSAVPGGALYAVCLTPADTRCEP